MHNVVINATNKIIARSKTSRARYLQRIAQAAAGKVHRAELSCGNLAHGFAACGQADKQALVGTVKPNIAIVSAYNDMLSAHQPYHNYPQQIKTAVNHAGGVAQFAGGVPAMCDGITQGQPGMELSLFSRDVIAMSTAIALSHNMFDGALYLGICDKIVPGLLMGALSFGHLPGIFVPAGPMASGLENTEKQRIRKLYAEGKAGRDELLAAESASYHSAGTCTFYGTANSNQLLMEIMGLHLPGAAFVHPDSDLRHALTAAAAQQVVRLAAQSGRERRALGEIVNEQAIVNGVIGLLATGGSTNHTIHLIAIAKAAGIILNWDDFAELSEVVPLLTRIYPNGSADINHFQAAGGPAFLIATLLNAGLLHDTVLGVTETAGLQSYTYEPTLSGEVLRWQPASTASLDNTVLRSVDAPFSADGGLKTLTGNLGRAVIKISALQPDCYVVEAPAEVFSRQEDVVHAFESGQLNRDVIVVVRYQGPKSNGMPELHKLMTPLAVLQDRGFKVALVTDGRLSGASGKVPAAIHLVPECLDGGLLAKVHSGDMIRVDAVNSRLELLVTTKELQQRIVTIPDIEANHFGIGRELFYGFRTQVGGAESGATSIGNLAGIVE